MNWLGMITGAVLGAAFGWLAKCPGNTCPITSHWWIPTVIGAVLGLTWPRASGEKSEDDRETPTRIED